MQPSKILNLLLTATTLLTGQATANPKDDVDHTVRVYVESATPIVDEQGEPLGVKLLKEIENHSELRFTFIDATYSRALYDLKARKADLVLHVPYLQQPGFDAYGLYLDWAIPTKADLYALTTDHFADLSAIGDKRIAIPRGNVDFASQITGIAPEKFFEVNSIRSLVKMLASGRVDLIWFERVAVRTELKRQNIRNVFYYEIPVLNKSGSVGIGLQNSPRGKRLKQRLEALLATIDTAPILAPYYRNLQPAIAQTGPVIHP